MGAAGEAVRRRAGVVVALLAFAAVGCTSVAHRQQEAVAPVIWDAQRAAFVAEADFDRRLRASRIVLLGESHDNAEHHALQVRLIGKLVDGGARPAVVMEQFDTAHGAALAAAQSAPDATPERLADAGRFNRRGWQWDFYAPIIARALAARLPVVAGNLSRDDARRVMQGGFDVLDGARSLGLPPTMSAEQAEIMTRAIVDGHCGMVSGAAARPMVAAQQARDAVMADALARHAERGAVLIAGSGHVRRDVGVPVYLARRGLDALAIGFVEAPPERAAEAAREAAPRYDIVWITAPMARADPCAAFRKPASTPR